MAGWQACRSRARCRYFRSLMRMAARGRDVLVAGWALSGFPSGGVQCWQMADCWVAGPAAAAGRRAGGPWCGADLIGELVDSGSRCPSDHSQQSQDTVRRTAGRRWYAPGSGVCVYDPGKVQDWPGRCNRIDRCWKGGRQGTAPGPVSSAQGRGPAMATANPQVSGGGGPDTIWEWWAAPPRETIFGRLGNLQSYPLQVKRVKPKKIMC